MNKFFQTFLSSLFFLSGVFCVLSIFYILKPELTADELETFAYVWATSFGVTLLCAMFSEVTAD